ncbi:hypothetical protein AFLA_011383 [Aspergillus flavus NRRL3357]|nr:hypothetical protein AFLA_011383 [Aspergillus flavus NRRL3357]
MSRLRPYISENVWSGLLSDLDCVPFNPGVSTTSWKGGGSFPWTVEAAHPVSLEAQFTYAIVAPGREWPLSNLVCAVDEISYDHVDGPKESWYSKFVIFSRVIPSPIAV